MHPLNGYTLSSHSWRELLSVGFFACVDLFDWTHAYASSYLLGQLSRTLLLWAESLRFCIPCCLCTQDWTYLIKVGQSQCESRASRREWISVSLVAWRAITLLWEQRHGTVSAHFVQSTWKGAPTPLLVLLRSRCLINRVLCVHAIVQVFRVFFDSMASLQNGNTHLVLDDT